ncbi:MAG: T9SS type A sorting domain-containing protein [candidate division Zixibacteria bacterium]|nr:T9SS type A sorting domain-containing protein [candidate division Zixibacteria bacterium]
MRYKKNGWKIWLMAIFLLFNGLSLTARADEIFHYNVTTNQNEISVVYTVNGEKYCFEDNFSLEECGAPELPYKIVRLALPANTKVGSFSAIGSNIENYAAGINHAYFEGDIKTGINEQYTPAPKNLDLYASSDLYPGKYAEVINKGRMGPQALASIAVYPIQYRPSDGQVILVGNIEIRIKLEDDFNASVDRLPKGASLLTNIVDNPKDLHLPSSYGNNGNGLIPGEMSLGLGAEYLIITSGELAPAFYPYFIWKNQKGLQAELVLIEDILQNYTGEDEPAKLRSYLQEAYTAGAKWVLLGGDEDVIPIRYAYPGNTSGVPELRNQQITDMYYMDLTGNWDSDGDGVYGEYNHDDPDIYPEVYVGRVPASNPEEAEIWVEKALIYEQNPGGGDYSYLTKCLFIAADQMVDLDEHVVLASLMPDNFEVDATRCIEEPSGGAEEPTQATGETIIDIMNEDWGFISNLNHGDFCYYSTKTRGYNHAPRSLIWGDIFWDADNSSWLFELEETDKFTIHYSISCMTAAYDWDKEVFFPGPYLTPNTYMEAYLFRPDRGGVAYLGNTRWGWVTSSYLLETKFLEYIFADTARNLAVAEALTKIYYPTKRDIGYGHTLFGDPEMVMWSKQPSPLIVSVPDYIEKDFDYTTVNVSTANGSAADINVCLWKPGELYYRGTTDEDGELQVPLNITETGDIYVAAVGIDMIPDIDTIHVVYQMDIDDDAKLPAVTRLGNNYPNPFNSGTAIKFSTVNPGLVAIEIFDICGRQVKTLVNDYYQAGLHTIAWNCRNNSGEEVASGAYLYRLKTDDKIIVKKMTLLK